MTAGMGTAEEELHYIPLEYTYDLQCVCFHCYVVTVLTPVKPTLCIHWYFCNLASPLSEHNHSMVNMDSSTCVFVIIKLFMIKNKTNSNSTTVLTAKHKAKSTTQDIFH